MGRRTHLILAATLALTGCAHPSPTTAAVAPPDRYDSFDAAMTACLDTQDHLVELYADEYLRQQGEAPSELVRHAFRDAWAEELAKKGTFDRFDAACVATITPARFSCAMAATTSDGAVACIRGDP